VTTALWLLAIQGAIGAFDTVYYHEWRARLPALGRRAAPELRIHAWRDFLYAILFGSLPWMSWRGWWVAALGAIILAEIALTLWDFVIEISVRKPLGDVYAGERITHAAMGILYGAMLAFLAPALMGWASEPTGLRVEPAPIPETLRWTLTAMAVGVFASGVRDLSAAHELPHAHWPWGAPAG
jgi:hypothetical protein